MKSVAAVLALSVAVIGAAAAGATVGRTAGRTTVHVVLGKPSEMRFTFDRTSVSHGAVVFQLTNKGVVAHDLRIDGSASKIAPSPAAPRQA